MKWISVCENTCREEEIQELKFNLSIGSMLEKLKKDYIEEIKWSQ